MTELLTGHLNFKSHLHRFGRTNDDICRLCNEEEETAAHLLCNCIAIELNRYLKFSVSILDPSDIAEVPLNRIVSFIDSSQFLKEL